MPRVQCPLPEFEDVYITYPDEWFMRDLDKFNLGWNLAPENAAPLTRQLYAAIALVEKVEGLDIEAVSELPLHYHALIRWLVHEVLNSYNEATQAPTKN